MHQLLQVFIVSVLVRRHNAIPLDLVEETAGIAGNDVTSVIATLNDGASFLLEEIATRDGLEGLGCFLHVHEAVVALAAMDLFAGALACAAEPLDTALRIVATVCN